MKWLASRLKEGTTWAGLGAMIPVGLQLAVDKNNPAMWGAFFSGLAAVLIPEKSQPKAN